MGSGLVLVAFLLLGGCDGVGIAATDNPYEKLAQADYLLSGPGRVMQARRQLDEAIPIFEQRADKAGLAKAWRLYGLLARVGGSKDNPVVRFDPRAEMKPSAEELDLSDEYLSRALGLAQETKQLYIVANIDYLLGNNETMRGTPLKGCPYYDLALKTFAEARQAQPDVKLQAAPGMSPEEGYALARKQAGCPDT